MSQFIYSKRSLDILKEVDVNLQKLFYKAIENPPYDFIIIEGRRSKARQMILFKAGKTKTLNSKHLSGKAVDIAVLIDKKITWEFSFYEETASYIKELAYKMQIEII